MKVLHIINNLGSGGAEKLIEEMLPIMNKYKDIKAHVMLLTDKNNVFEKTLKNSNVKLIISPVKKIYNPLNIYYIRKFIIEGNYDIVHAHLFPTIYWTALVSKLIFDNKPKFIMTEHNTHNRRREKKHLRYMEKFIYFSYDKIISISEQTQNNLVKWLKPKQKELDKFIVVENGISVNKFKNAVPYKKSEICNKFTNEVKLLCMVGRFSKQKDQLTIIKAMKDLPQNVHLLLVGEGELKYQNKQLAKELGVNDRVHFLGFRNDVERILKTCDIVVLSSNWEGFGLAAVEGMAAGKPLIASDVPGLKEIVQDAGKLFSKNDSKELAKIIKELLFDRIKYNDIAQKCKVRSENYDINKMIENYITIYRIVGNAIDFA